MANINDKITDSNLFESPETFYGSFSKAADKDKFPDEADMKGKDTPEVGIGG